MVANLMCLWDNIAMLTNCKSTTQNNSPWAFFNAQGFFMYAGHVPVLGGVSPLWPRESGPLSEDKGVTVRWGLKEVLATATT
jgi:hypothetical protein